MGPGFGDEIGKSLVTLIVIVAVTAFGLGIGCAVAWRYLPSIEIHWQAAPPPAGEARDG